MEVGRIRGTGSHDRTTWGFVCCLVVIGLLALSLTVPWWVYKFSTGPRAPPGGPQPENETFEERERLEFFPYRTDGRSNNTTAADVQEVTRNLGHLVLAPLIITALVALAELPIPIPFSTRWFTLVLVPIAFVSAAGALVYSWFQIPPLLEAAGVAQVFTTRSLVGGYVQTWMYWGWPLAAVAAGILPAIFAFKYQAGATDPTVIEAYRPPATKKY